jgi:hypothetical protein
LKAQGWLKGITVANRVRQSNINSDDDEVNGYDFGEGTVGGVDGLDLDAMPIMMPFSALPLQIHPYEIDPEQGEACLKPLELLPLVPMDSDDVNRVDPEGLLYGRTAASNQNQPASGPQFDLAYDKALSHKVGSAMYKVETPGRGTLEPCDTNNIIQMTSATDSGYGTGQSGSKIDGQSVAEDDTESIVTDGSQAPIQGENKTLLEKAFAHEVSNRFNTLMQESFASRSDMATDLLYAFSVMIGKRASTIPERGAASFVRRGRR